jgi:hypothetical protein
VKRQLWTAIALAGIAATSLIAKRAAADTTHTPADSSSERQSLLKALPRHYHAARFTVNYTKVHNGWCWSDVTPLDEKGKAVAEGGPELLHLKAGKWTVLDLNSVPPDPKDPMGPEDASIGFVKNLHKKFNGVPADIFPKPAH